MLDGGKMGNIMVSGGLVVFVLDLNALWFAVLFLQVWL